VAVQFHSKCFVINVLLENVQESKAVVICDIPEYHQVMQILQSDECRRQVREYLYKAVRHYGPIEVDIVIQGDLKVFSLICLCVILCNIIVILLYGDGTGNTVGELWLVLGNPYVLVTFSRGMQQ